MKRAPIHRRLVPPAVTSSASSAVAQTKAPRDDASARSGKNEDVRQHQEKPGASDAMVEDKLQRTQRLLDKIRAKRDTDRSGANGSISANEGKDVKSEKTSREQGEKLDKVSSEHKSIQTSQNKLSESSSSEEEEDEAAIAEKRRLLKERIKAKQLSQNKATETKSNDQSAFEHDVQTKSSSSDQPTSKPTVANQPSEESSSASSESSDESSSSSSSDGEDSDDALPMLTFVSKQVRDTQKALTEKEELEEEMREERLREQRHALAIKSLDKAMKEEELKKRLEATKGEDNKYGLRPGRPDDTDGLDEEGEYEAWKAREFTRLAREYGVVI